MRGAVPAELTAHLSDVLDAAQGALVFLDRDLRILHCNAHALRWVQSPLGEVVGQRCYFVIHRRDAPCDDCPALRALATGERASLCQSALEAGGRTRWTEVAAFPIVEAGETRFLIVHGADITTRVAAERERTAALRALRESEARYRTMLENSNDVICTVDLHGNFTWCNRQAEELTGYRREDAIGKPFTPLIDREDLPRIRRVFAEVLGGRPQSYEARVRAKDGRTLVLLVNTAPMFADGKPVGSVSFGKDITERKRAEERLRSVLDSTDEQLRRQVAELMTAIDAAERERQRVREAVQQRHDFLRMMAHDVRGPLNAAVLNAEAIRRGARTKDDAACVRHAEAILRSARRIDGMLGDLVDSDHVEAGQIALVKAEVSSDDLLADVLSGLAPSDQGRIEISCDGPPPRLLADRGRIGRALTNLVTNALKYTPPEGLVTLRTTAAEGQVSIAVVDRGPGIDPVDLPFIFERAYRARSSQGSEGLGLGLYITRLVVEAHGGRVGVESLPGLGSTFVITLPSA